MKKNNLFYIKDYLLIAVVIFLFGFFLFGKYTFRGVYFVNGSNLTDILRVNLPVYYTLYDKLSASKSIWSWSMGIGTSFFVNTSVIYDPFSYILFIGGREHIADMLIWSCLTKIVFEGITLYAYLNLFDFSIFSKLVACIMYAFSGYSIIMGSSNPAYGTMLVYLPLIALGIERMLSSHRKAVLVISLSLVGLYSFYHLYQIAILSCVYVIIVLYRDDRLEWRVLCSSFFELFFCGIIAVLISLPSLLPYYKLLRESPRTSISNSSFSFFRIQFEVLATSIVRMINTNAFGDSIWSLYFGRNPGGDCDFYQNATFTGIVFIPFLIIVLLSHNVESKPREIVKIVLFIMTIMISLSLFSGLFNAFANVNGRWMYALTFVQAVMMGFVLNKIEENQVESGLWIKACVLTIIILFASLFLFSLSQSTPGLAVTFWRSKTYRLASIALLIMACVFIEYLYKKKYVRYLGVLLIVALDLLINYFPWLINDTQSDIFRGRDVLPYNDDSLGIIEEILQYDQEEHFRIYKDFDSVYDGIGIPSENDAMVQGYYGIKSYTNLNNPQYISFLQTMGIYLGYPAMREYYKANGCKVDEIHMYAYNYIDGIDDKYQLLTFLGVKYFITGETDVDPGSEWSLLYEKNGYKVYRNNEVYPFCFAQKSDDYELDNSQACIEGLFRNNEVAPLEWVSFSEDKLEFYIDIPEDATGMSSSIPYDKNWHIYVDGEKQQTTTTNISMLGCGITPGRHFVEIRYIDMELIIGCVVSILTILMLLCGYLVRGKACNVRFLLFAYGHDEQ